MKKQVIYTYTLLCLVCHFAYPAPVRPIFFIPYINTSAYPIQIDGQTQDWLNGVLSNRIHFFPGDGMTGNNLLYGTTVLNQMDGPSDGEVRISLCHDGNYLYVLADIHDDFLEQRNGENNTNEAWKEDALHLYIDSTNSASPNIPNPPIVNQIGYEQFGVSTDFNCFTENCDFTTNNGTPGAARLGAQPDQINWLVGITISGQGPFEYIFEERIPLHEIPGHNLRTMLPGHSYGFNAEFVDSDQGVYAQGWFFWSGDGQRDVWNYENMWGLINLQAIPSNIANWELY